MRKVWLSKSWIVCEAFVAERIQVLWDGNAVLDDESRHGTSACLGPDGLHLQVIPLTDIEQGLVMGAQAARSVTVLLLPD